MLIKTSSKREIQLVWKGSRKEQLRSVTISFQGKDRENPAGGPKIGSTHAAGEIIYRIREYSGPDELLIHYLDEEGRQFSTFPRDYPGPIHPELTRAKWPEDKIWKLQNWEVYLQTL